MEKISIAIGKSRFETNWKNQNISWENLVQKLRTPKVTSETYAEYCRMSKDNQGKVKDVGGFVGGHVRGGRRVHNSVEFRSMLTLDIDNAQLDFFTDFCLEYDCEAVLYSTHKHSKDTPRYRLLVPLSREVLPDEHEAVARKVAGVLGIELFDPTTFQTERLMYWPSVSKDGEYVFETQTGAWLDPDRILEQYADWRDTAEWPVSEKAKKTTLDSISKQEDPILKGGMVGVFCRTYGIKEAIEKYLSDVYQETDNEDRFTYRLGSTFGGVLVYDNKFSLSYHSTDPTSGRLCNSFDLVRIHLYGDSDDRIDESTPLNKKPSYGKMLELLTQDEQVRKQVVGDKVQKRTKLIESSENINEDDWQSALEVDKRGNILNTIANVVVILNNDSNLKGTLGFDDLRKVAIVLRDLPWRKISKFTKTLTDADESELRNYLELLYGITARDKIRDALEIVIHQHTYHPVQQYLKGLVWDGVDRLDNLLIDYLGAEPTDYVKQVTRKVLVAAVARVFEPGIKFDHVLVLVGPQGYGKSRLVARLGMDWYSDTFGSLHTKDAMEQIQGVWIMEIGELAGLKKQEVETIKLFISKQEDRFRVAYGRRVESFARQCIFIGTTNNSEFLQDPTGNRRFWPVKVGVSGKGKDVPREIVDQVWAEACYRYAMGETLYLGVDVEMIAREVQEEYTEQDAWESEIVRFLEKKLPVNWPELNTYERRDFIVNGSVPEGEDVWEREFVTVPEIWCELLGGHIKDIHVANKKIRNIMNKLKGWESKLINRKPYGTQRGWIRTSSVLQAAGNG